MNDAQTEWQTEASFFTPVVRLTSRSASKNSGIVAPPKDGEEMSAPVCGFAEGWQHFLWMCIMVVVIVRNKRRKPH